MQVLCRAAGRTHRLSILQGSQAVSGPGKQGWACKRGEGAALDAAASTPTLPGTYITPNQTPQALCCLEPRENLVFSGQLWLGRRGEWLVGLAEHPRLVAEAQRPPCLPRDSSYRPTLPAHSYTALPPPPPATFRPVTRVPHPQATPPGLSEPPQELPSSQIPDIQS